MVKRISILLSSLLLFWACGEDNNTPDDTLPTGFDFNLVTIENVSEPTEEGLRTITLKFTDKEDNALKLTAASWYSHLETGYYEIATSADIRHKASVELSIGNENVKVNGGSIAVSKWNYEYDIRFEMETEKGKFAGIADNKKIYFETQKYSSLSKGANEIYQKDLTVHSDLMNTNVKYSIYLPESYDGKKKYPVLYMLHGYGGNNNDWLQDNTGSIWAGGGTMPAYAREYAQKTGKELIIVAPDGGNNFYCDGFNGGPKYMSFFFEEFIPYIESTYAIKAEKKSRAIGGLSMGGYGSLYYGTLHPEMFCYVYACSAAINVGVSAPDPAQLIAKTVGAGKIDQMPGFTLEIGTEDTTVGSNDPFIYTLAGYGIPYEYITRPGSHDWPFWNACSPKIIHKVLTTFE
jgi:enterochelin esterase-like enzyme